MPSETFYCPHCQRKLTKSAQTFIEGEIIENNGYSITIGSSERSENVICPGCGGSIDYMKMIKGAYDYGKPISGKKLWLYSIVAIAVFVILYLVSNENGGFRKFLNMILIILAISFVIELFSLPNRKKWK